MNRRSAAVLSVALLPILVFGQGDIPFDKAHIADQEALDRAMTAIRAADKHAGNGGTEYALALPLYEEAYAVNPDNAELNLKIGLCHLNGKDRAASLSFFQTAMALDPSIKRIHYLVGLSLQLNAKWDEAIEEFELHQKAQAGMPDENPVYNLAYKNIIECRNGKSLMAHPVKARVTALGGEVNSEYADYGVLVSADASAMFFTSRRPNSTGGKVNKATNEYFEDVYLCKRDGDAWGSATPLPEPVNGKLNDASVGLFNDGRTMLIYREVRGSGDLFETQRTGASWSEPRPLGPNVNTKYHESSAWYSFDRKWLYFVSARPEVGIGGQDIYRSRWDETTKDWGESENLGPDINTKEDEDGVFIHPDGRTIYFSSKGHTSMGGYDIFRSTFDNGRWTKPVNLGWPINSPDDDLFFVMTASGEKGYFSSPRAGGAGEDDIYQVLFQTDPKDVETASAAGVPPVPEDEMMATVLVKGFIKDLRLLKGLGADVDLMDLNDASLVARFQSDEQTGEFIVVVPAGKDYAMHIRAKGYLFHSENIHVPEGRKGVELNMEIALQPIENGSQVVLNNIFFAPNESALEANSIAELEELKEMMLSNPGLRLEIGGHTDASGGEAQNVALSKARAQAVVEHLVAQGIALDRLESKGYGATMPLAANDTPENKARNRRTEMRIIQSK